MAKTDNLTDFLTSVANAIRAKKGTSDLINPQNFDSEIASISTSGSPIDISTSDEMTALLVEANVGKVYRFTGTTDETYTNGDLYEVASISGTYKYKQYALALPQLYTPVNVSADGTTVSWDEVENATSYEILADGTSIGEVNN